MSDLPNPEGGQPEENVPFHALMNQPTAEAFKTLMTVEDVNGSELLRRMVGTYNHLKEVEFRGGRVYTKEPGEPFKELFIGSNAPPNPKERLRIATYIKQLIFRTKD